MDKKKRKFIKIPKQITLSTTSFVLLVNLLNAMSVLSKQPIYVYVCISVLLQATIVICSSMSARLDVGKNVYILYFIFYT